MTFAWPDAIDEPIVDYLRRVGTVLRDFGERVGSRATVLGVEVEGERYVVKSASDPGAIDLLESAERLHEAVTHAAIAGITGRFRTEDGLALVERWAPGDVLQDSFDPAVLAREHPGSAYQRLLALPAPEIARALAAVFDAHAAICEAGFVAVDLHDSCFVYDFTDRVMTLVDLDNYAPGPFELLVDRQFGSSAYMAPEEWQRGATIDERTTVFTLGRIALVLLGCSRSGQPIPDAFRGTATQFDLAMAATAAMPQERIQTVRALADAWAAG